MNQLAANIEYFLLSRNCVIVPSLGAFYAVDTPARWVDTEEVFLPPVRHIQFDSSITEDPDQYFVHALAEVYGVTLDVARKRCQKMVEEFHKILFHEESIDFGSIGVFSIEDDLGIVLSSCECGIITPGYYGLDTLHFGKVKADDLVNVSHKTIMEIIPEHNVQNPLTDVSSSTRTSDNIVNNSSDESYYTLRINKSAVNYVMAIAATIILFFIMRPVSVLSDNNVIKQEARPVMFLQPEMVVKSSAESQQFDLIDLQNEEDKDDDVLDDLIASEAFCSDDDVDNILVDVTDELDVDLFANQKPVAEVNATKSTPTTNSSNSVPTTNKSVSHTANSSASTTTTNSNNSNSAYCIVLASGVSKANAEVFVKKLAKDNINAVVLEGELRRVVIDGFSSYSSAHQHLSALKASGDCHDAWILKK